MSTVEPTLYQCATCAGAVPEAPVPDARVYVAGETLVPGVVYVGADGRLYQLEHPDLMRERAEAHDRVAKDDPHA